MQRQPDEASARLKRRYPTAADLRKAARSRIPNFAFEFADGGAGGNDENIVRNWASLDGVELVPRYGKVVSPSPCDTTIFGRPYSAPLGIAPMGGPSVVLPGGDVALARAAQRARIPYVMSTFAGITIEEAGELAPDVLWMQLSRFPRDEHRIGLDMLRRADAAGAHVLMLLMDTPVRTARPREVKGGLMTPFRLNARLCLDALMAPRWLCSLARHGSPRLANLAAYLSAGAGLHETTRFSQTQMGGAFSWDELARYRDQWKKPLVLKGIMHPADVEKAIALGFDGVVVSNHGGRQIDALPATIDLLPALFAAGKGKLSVMLDSGVRSGTDVARAVALGADAAFAGKAFLWSLGALGARGPGHLIELFQDELRATLGQVGCSCVEELRTVPVRHPTAYRAEEFERRALHD
jgi:L-lactate dehydrogenase (cytochrome)